MGYTNKIFRVLCFPRYVQVAQKCSWGMHIWSEQRYFIKSTGEWCYLILCDILMNQRSITQLVYFRRAFPFNFACLMLLADMRINKPHLMIWLLWTPKIINHYFVVPRLVYQVKNVNIFRSQIFLFRKCAVFFFQMFWKVTKNPWLEAAI